jgi:carbon-monoxide dehydrogenase small subunit
MIMTSVQLLARDPKPSREAIAHGLAGNLCRCTGYTHIIDAVEHAAGMGGGR